MGHYDDNRKFDDEWRATHDAALRHPKKLKIEKVPVEVSVPTETYTPATLRRWTDGAKWVCDTMGAYDASVRESNVGCVWTNIEGIAEFIDTYPHPVGTFYVIASSEEVAKLIVDNPERDIRHLVMK